MPRPAALERRLGHRFQTPALLEQALTHRSHAVQHNERLEFLGDGVLGCAIAQELYERYPQIPEGKLTQLRATLVREETLAELAAQLKLEEFVRMGASPSQPSILADALEAVFAAVFLDGGYDAARKIIVRVYGPVIENLDAERVAKDAKTRLQEFLQAKHQPLPEYRILSARHAPQHNVFEVQCTVAALGLSAAGSGSSRQRAEQQAAQAILDQIEK